MIQDEKLIRQAYPGCQEVRQCSDNRARAKVALWVVITTDDQDALVMALGFQNEVVQ
jgi:hypothetical protein